jgi:NTP pyrophosphatase (non-canonical NTP hydrolase)
MGDKHLNEINELIERIRKFRDERDWGQFHNSKDLSIGLSVEAAELNELFLWKDSKEVDKKRLSEELADVLIYALMLAEKNNLDVREIILSKLELNDKKYPVEKSRGKSNKYNEL